MHKLDAAHRVGTLQLLLFVTLLLSCVVVLGVRNAANARQVVDVIVEGHDVVLALGSEFLDGAGLFEGWPLFKFLHYLTDRTRPYLKLYLF